MIGHGSSRVRHQAHVDGLALVVGRSTRRLGNDWQWDAACLCEEVCVARMRLECRVLLFLPASPPVLPRCEPPPRRRASTSLLAAAAPRPQPAAL